MSTFISAIETERRRCGALATLGRSLRPRPLRATRLSRPRRHSAGAGAWPTSVGGGIGSWAASASPPSPSARRVARAARPARGGSRCKRARAMARRSSRRDSSARGRKAFASSCSLATCPITAGSASCRSRPGQITLPGPVDPARLLALELDPGALADAVGLVQAKDGASASSRRRSRGAVQPSHALLQPGFDGERLLVFGDCFVATAESCQGCGPVDRARTGHSDRATAPARHPAGLSPPTPSSSLPAPGRQEPQGFAAAARWPGRNRPMRGRCPPCADKTRRGWRRPSRASDRARLRGRNP